SKTCTADFIRYHLHFSDSHCPGRLRRLVNEGRIEQYLDDMDRKVSEAITRQVELWKQVDGFYQRSVLRGDVEKMLGLENSFISMARESVFECMVYI
ncbi:MAG: hypothetical protein IKH75_04345, partial [Ruminococcus sp.]|nr:hypothetical protein [Ruminococcus sp.]